MKSIAFAILVIFSATNAFSACTTTTTAGSASASSPQQVVEQLWKAATEGQLLTPEG